MDLSGKSAGAVTPVKNRSKIPSDQNYNPNVKSPSLKSPKSPAIKSASKIQKSASKDRNPTASPSPRNRIRERKFVVAKRNLKKDKQNQSTAECKCKDKVGSNSQKCMCVAYEILRASHEEFFKNRGSIGGQRDSEKLKNCQGADNGVDAFEIPSGYGIKPGGVDKMNGENAGNPDEIDRQGEMGISMIKRRRERFLEEARRSVPESGTGRVMHLVKAFEKILTIPNSKEPDQTDHKNECDEEKGMKYPLPGLQHPAPETQVSSSSFCPSDIFLTSESLGLDLTASSSSSESSHGSFTISRTSGGRHRSRRKGSESFGENSWKKRQLKATSQKPFKLQTEQRGRYKEEEFIKKVQQIMTEEEKQRIPIAQGLPWTTDEPECLVKPPVKESTRPIDVVLNSDVRAVERAEFEQQVAGKMCLVEQYREERDRQQKLEEEEEIKRLRKELVPRAQPMPYFDRPFIPRRSQKNPTVPREPKFQMPHHKKIKSCRSLGDAYSSNENGEESN
ncbi:microtubule-destabilizing protein 60-like [Diospyros lotus]|uniref:microtubule-destabilizing protein 60-like n=1 Tax=Diospyros lotus TaxID=55363 RepID=UPI00225505E9|nr:microtubule-destabilizing protein 60-like [Diospyros lotus]